MASYREEIAVLKFKGIDENEDQKEKLSLHQMLYSMNALIDKSGAEHLSGKLDQQIFEARTVQYFNAVKSDLMSYQALLEGLSRRCRANAGLLTNEALDVEDAKDIKSLFFVELPTNLMPFITRLSLALKSSIIMTMNGNELPEIFDPIK